LRNKSEKFYVKARQLKILQNINKMCMVWIIVQMIDIKVDDFGRAKSVRTTD